MSIEVLLFVSIGLIAVGAAVGMLITTNAVHSALFLILNFACVAFLYLLLDAPFLALVQVAVYAGAIMVLFLFVIMLLGAERTLHEVRQFKWLAPVTLTLALSFLIAVTIAMDQGEIDTQPVAEGDPMLRVINVLPDFQDADFYLDGELFAADVEFGGMEDDETVQFEGIVPGTYQLSVAEAGDDALQLPLGSVTVTDGTFVTVVAHGVIGSEVRPTVTTISEGMEFYLEDAGRFTMVNAYAGGPVRIVDAGGDRIISDDETPDVIFESLAVGDVTPETLETTSGRNWVVVEIPEDPELVAGDVLARAPEGAEIESGANNLWIVATDVEDDALRPVLVALVTDTLPQYGSAEAIGSTLFTDYVLPFEMVAMLLLAAMVGAIVLTQRGDVKPKPGRPIRRKVSRPLTSVIATQTGHSVSTEDEEETALEVPEPAGD